MTCKPNNTKINICFEAVIALSNACEEVFKIGAFKKSSCAAVKGNYNGTYYLVKLQVLFSRLLLGLQKFVKRFGVF